MKSALAITAIVLTYMVFALSSCATQEEMAPAKPAAPAAAKAPPAEKAAKAEKAPAAEKAAKAEKGEAKAKGGKVSGDVGLLDLEKNYMIIVTKDGKLITLDFDAKTPVTQITPTDAKMEDIGLGSSATAEYQTKGDKKVLSSIIYKPAKGGD